MVLRQALVRMAVCTADHELRQHHTARARQVVRVGCCDQHNDRNADGGYDTRPLADCASLLINGRTRQ